MPAIAILNGQAMQHKDLDLRVAIFDPETGLIGLQFQFNFVESISYKTEAKKDPVRNQQGEIKSFTYLQQDQDGAMKTKLDEWDLFQDWAESQGSTDVNGKPKGMGELIFEGTFTRGNSINKYKTDRVIFMLDGDAFTSQDDQKALSKEVPLFVLRVNPVGRLRFVVYP